LAMVLRRIQGRWRDVVKASRTKGKESSGEKIRNEGEIRREEKGE